VRSEVDPAPFAHVVQFYEDDAFLAAETLTVSLPEDDLPVDGDATAWKPVNPETLEGLVARISSPPAVPERPAP
jgi:hypothetical protein